MDWKKIKLKENKPSEDPTIPRFTLALPIVGNMEATAGQQILTRLKGSADMLIELNANLMFSKHANVDRLFATFCDTLRAMDVPVHENTVPAVKKSGLFEFLTGAKKDKQLAYAVVTDAMWQDERVQKAIPTSGVKYYVMREPADPDAEKIFARMYMTAEAERLKTFAFIYFDMSELGQIGLNTRQLTAAEIQARLDG